MLREELDKIKKDKGAIEQQLQDVKSNAARCTKSASARSGCESHICSINTDREKVVRDGGSSDILEDADRGVFVSRC